MTQVSSPSRRIESLSVAQARRVALGAQGFTDAIPRGTPDRRALRRVVGRTGLFQIDSVNVLARAHYLPLFSRIGPYPTTLLERAAYRSPRSLFEYWGHEASLLPVELHPLLRWRMNAAETHSWPGMRAVVAKRPDLLPGLLADIKSDGPLTAAELAARHDRDQPRRTGPWWDWSDVKRALEYLFWAGEITTAERRGFERAYDIPERVLPASVLAAPAPDRAEAQRELLRRSIRSLGVATSRDLRDYYRLPAADCKARIAELAEAGELLPVTVEGWKNPAFLDPEAAFPRRIARAALLSPFDPVVWERDRTERLFGFRYRIEIYVPAHKRVHGYYVLPFLLNEQLVARVDLKADRKSGVLLVQSAWREPDAPDETAQRLATELHQMVRWLGLDGVIVRPKGDLAFDLGEAITAPLDL
ncbi:MAG: winged helix-turn-helix domain-containing protein [Actinomycetes bacterium]